LELPHMWELMGQIDFLGKISMLLRSTICLGNFNGNFRVKVADLIV
jgi:hypothetical protein